ncbi:hypothetical protein AK830_g409 [Neonectria ditissima]|uniref:Uncharacterized protein n=1 Tax=Neonectria ditissima TaxID=78410 RepID=A0A0P7BGW6_9HYPO|nr:hypothetical protein AK830_g409 [Neonectria ditissima]
MADEAKPIAKKIIELVGLLGHMPATDFAQRLHYKASRSRRAAEFKEHNSLDLGSSWPGDDPNPSSAMLAEFAVPTQLARLADASVARAIQDTDNQFKGKVDFAASNEVYGEEMTKLTYLCYLEHMNMTLKERPIEVWAETVKDFRSLRLACAKEKIPIGDFLKYELTRPNFVAKTIQDDIIQGDNRRSMSLLFITDFLCRDPYAEQWPNMDKEFVFKPSFEMLTQWSRTLWELRGKGNKEQTQKIIVFCGRTATPVYCPDSVLGPSSTYDVTVGLYKHIIENTSEDHQYKDELREALEGLIRDAVDAWKSIYHDLTSTWWVAQFPLWNDAVKKELAKDNGKQIDQWIKDGAYLTSIDNPVGSQLLIFEAPGYVWENEICPPGQRILKLSQVGNGAYLLVGTYVTLADGTTCQASQLQQGDRLLTLAKPQAHGEVARDMWPMEVTAPLVGFNGEEPFATTAQVFHTTTGLRAVNPRAAMRQNPWLNVGCLAVGHVLYRHLSQAQDYETVEVKSIQKTAPATWTAYSLRLSEGERLHHQNGYLVNVNEPEIRVQDVATLLGRFSPKEQMALLSSLKEVRSMLLTYGPQAVWERLQMELGGYEKASKEPWPSSLEFPLFASHADSRPQKRLSHLTRRFQLEPTSFDQKLPVEKLPQVTLVDGVLLLDEEAHPRVAVNDGDRVVSWTRKIRGKDLFEHGRLEVYATDDGGVGTLFYSSELDPQSFKDGQIVKANAVLSSASTSEAALYSSPEGGSSSSSGLTSKWSLTLDKSAWPKEERRDNPKTPASFDFILTGSETIPEGIKVNFSQVPLLDSLLVAINKDRDSKKKQPIEEDLYRSHMEFVWGKDEDDQPVRLTRTYITLTQASLVLSLSDQEPTSTNVFDLTFKKSLGIDLRLPALFESFYIDTDAFADTVTGALYELDPTKREAKGERHLVVGKYEDDDDFEEVVRRDRAFASQAFASHVTAGLSPEHDPQLQPAAITALLKTTAEVTVEKLYQMAYNADDVHSLAQTAIQEMMYYHMDKKQLETFTSRGRPDHLPSELTTQLDPDLKQWLKDTYAPAFITRNISQLEKYKVNFKGNDIEKVWYWWAGNGDRCLAHNKEYTQLNTISSAYAMKKKYDFLDMEPSKATELAEKLYTAIKTKRKMKDVLYQPDNGDQINKLCIVLHTLHPEKTYAHDWFREIVQYAIKAHLELPFLKDDDGKYVEEWLGDAMRELVVKVLSNDQSIAKDVRNQLEKELGDFMEKTGIDKAWTIQKKADSIVEKMSVFTTEIGKLLVIVGNGLARASGVKRLFGLARDLVDKVVSKVGDTVQKLARGLGYLTVVSYFVGMVLPLVGVIKDWKSLTPAQRATGILEALRGVVAAVDKGFETWQKYKESNTPAAELAVSETILDGNLSAHITSPEGEGIVNLGDEFYHNEGGLEMRMAEHAEQARSVSSEENVPAEREVWNEERSSTPEHLTPNEEQTASKLSTTSKWLRGASIVVGLAIGFAMTFSLVQEWDRLTNAGKVINTLSVIVQILSVVVEVADLLLTTGLVACATLSVALPVIGAVLAVLGIVLMIVSLFIDMYKTEPQPNPVGDFVRDVARSMIKPWNDPPPSKLTYSLNTTAVGASSTATVTITGKNTGQDVSLAYTQMSVWTGQSDECLFSEEAFHLPNDAEKKGGTTTLAPSDLAKPTLKPTLLGEKPNRYWAYNVWASGAKSAGNKMGSLTVPSGKEFQCSFLGKVNRAGKSIIEIVETTIEGGKAHTVLDIKRV